MGKRNNRPCDGSSKRVFPSNCEKSSADYASESHGKNKYHSTLPNGIYNSLQ